MTFIVVKFVEEGWWTFIILIAGVWVGAMIKIKSKT
jgi:hypothetical protein